MKTLFLVLCFKITTPTYAYIIREANSTDITELTNCHFISWHSTYDNILDNTYCLKNVRKRIENYWIKFFSKKENVFALIAEEDKKIIGLISAGPFKNIKEENLVIPDSNITAEIYKLYVLQENQKSGIGKALLQACTERLILENYKELLVRVFSANQNACCFYVKQGFCFCNLLNDSESPPYNIYYLRLK